MTITLLDIPAFLQKGTPENIKALEEGTARLANPHRAASTYKKKARIAPTKTQKKRIKRNSDAKIRATLVRADFSVGFSNNVPIAKARKILADLAAGLGVGREDMI
jgi:hypothetical protein